jgi:hypothetical protein
LSGGGALTSNVTISLASVPVANVTGLGTMATQNANAVAITGGTVTATLSGNLTSANVTITGGTINSVAFTNGTFANANITSVAVAFPNTFLANSTATLDNATITLGSATTTVGTSRSQTPTLRLFLPRFQIVILPTARQHWVMPH